MGSKVKQIKITNMSDSRGAEYHVMTRKPFWPWRLRAVLFHYNDARRYAKFLRENKDFK